MPCLQAEVFRQVVIRLSESVDALRRGATPLEAGMEVSGKSGTNMSFEAGANFDAKATANIQGLKGWDYFTMPNYIVLYSWDFEKPAERAKAKGVEECYFDRGGFLFHGKVKALADAAREGGLKF